MGAVQYKGWAVRLLMGLLLPVPLASVLMMGIGVIADGEMEVLKSLAVFTVFGYFFMAIPSLIFTLVMEFVVNRKLANDGYVLLCGALLGALSGLTFLGEITLSFLAVLGGLVGLACAYLLRRHFKRCNSVLADVTV